MTQIIKVRCNGQNRHINEINLDKILKPTLVLRGMPRAKYREIPERLILPCQHCAEGTVIITKEMIESV